MKIMSELYDVQAESIWISTAIYHPEFLRIDSNIRPSFFHDKVNQCLVWAIQELAISKGVDTIDALNLQTVISSNAAVEKIITDSGITDIQEYLDIAKPAARSTYEEFKMNEDDILTFSFRRELNDFSYSLGTECENRNVSLEQLTDFCNDGIDKIISKYVFGADSREIGQEIDEAWKEIIDKRTSNGYGIPYIVPRINEFTTLVPGEMDILMGKTGKGKSAFFLTQSLYCALELKIPTLIIDSELPTTVWLPRALASISGVPVWKIKTGQCTPDEDKKITNARKTLKKLHIVHYFLPQFDKLTIEQVSRKWVSKGYKLIILDYIKPDGKFGAAELSQSLGLQADFMKGIAGRLNVAVLCGLQQNQKTGDAADSQKPERYCDCMMKWEEKTPQEIAQNPNSGNIKLSITKNRNGSCTDDETYVDINFQRDVMRIGGADMHTVTGDINPFNEQN